jgi:hypothetical protein
LEREVPPGESIFGYFPAIVRGALITQKMERHRDNFLLHCPEFVIVDEVHGAAQPPGQKPSTTNSVTSCSKKLRKTQTAISFFLTATPHSGVEESFRSLLALLDPEFGEYNLAELTQEQKDKLARHFIQRRRGDVRRWLGEETKFPERELLEVTYTLSPPYKQLFH